MDGFTKLFTRILDSTVWREDDQTRLLWITMLALADRNGVVRCTIPGLADRARITLEQCERGLQRFQEPDKYSWSQLADGRRVELVEDGWRLINYSKYREMMVSEQHAERQRKYRERHAASRSVTHDNEVTKVTQAEAEAEAYADKAKPKATSAFELPNWVPKEAWNHYEEMRRRIRKPMTDQARIWAVRMLDKLQKQGHSPTAVLEQSVFNSWQGLFEVRNDNHTQAGRDGGQRVNTQVQRSINNRRAILEAAGMDDSGGSDSAGQTPRPRATYTPLLEGKAEET